MQYQEVDILPFMHTKWITCFWYGLAPDVSIAIRTIQNNAN